MIQLNYDGELDMNEISIKMNHIGIGGTLQESSVNFICDMVCMNPTYYVNAK